MRRIRYICTTTTANSSAITRQNVFQYSLGTTIGGIATGGFFKVMRFGISDSIASGCRQFYGMSSATLPVGSDPSTYTDAIGVGCDVADTNMSIYYGGSSAQTPIPLGADFPANTDSTTAFELVLSSVEGDVGDKVVSWQFTNLSTGVTAEGTLTATTAGVELPLNTTLLSAHMSHRNNGANTGVAPAFDLCSDYIETNL
jgi:hypothetical protein